MEDERVRRLTNLRDELAELEVSYPNSTWTPIESWIAKATPIIRSDWPDSFEDFQAVSAKPSGTGIMYLRQDLTISEAESRRLWRLDNEKSARVKHRILSFLDGLLILAPVRQEEAADSALFICRRFPIFAHQLKDRERGRPPIEIGDEYDVQYLLLAILRLHFEDVRKEVWTPSYAGGGSRMDFLLKREKIVIEAKMTRQTLKRDSQIGDQLIVDIDRYAQHPDCRLLICFVYDPALLLDNPKGLEEDLSGPRGNIEVVVVVSPGGAS